MKFRTAILIFDLALVMLIGGIFIGKAIPKTEPKIVKAESVCESVTPIYEDVLESHFKNLGYYSIDYTAIVDKFPEGDWYCYYICAGGDCYIVTLKNGKVDICQQLN